ncbi:MAG: hypothetical protein DMG79_21330 [Acidobacteria bacterium]|nr:MAG: hypothetical protein DMG79_21330 [Acidobacteriota bacterium]
MCDGVSRDEVNEQENEAHHQPDNRKGVEDALEEAGEHAGLIVGSFVVGRRSSVVGRSQFSVVSCVVILSVASANALAESKDPFHSLHARPVWEFWARSRAVGTIQSRAS